MHFTFNERAATQAAAYLLAKTPDRQMDIYSLVKLLYLANRESLIKTGCLISGDRLANMEWGPVAANSYDLMKNGGREWSRYIAPRDKNAIRLQRDAPTSALCDSDREILDEVFLKYGHLSFGALMDICHDLPEWFNPREHGAGSIVFDPVVVLEKAGVPKETIQQYDEIVSMVGEVDDQLSGL
jgi:uncharacterized phage-associated protein